MTQTTERELIERAPERIWAHCELGDDCEWFIEFLSETPWPGEDGGVGYIREDVAQAQIAALQSRLEAEGEQEKTPITDEWLASVDFKWSQSERQPNKHWKLVCNIEEPGTRMIQQTSIELQRNGWNNSKGDYVGDPASWTLWVTDTFQRTTFIRNIQWQEEVIALAELITGRTWDPGTHIYGQAWPEGSRALCDAPGGEG